MPAAAESSIGLSLHEQLRLQAWALVWIPAHQAASLYAPGARELQAWGTLWKRRGYPEFRWFDPLVLSEDQALTRVTNALTASPTFVNRHQGGDFYAIPAKYCLRIPGFTRGKFPRSLLIEFGMAGSLESALSRVEQALLGGTAFPPRTSMVWREKLSGGVVVPVPTHKRVRVSTLAGNNRDLAEEPL